MENKTMMNIEKDANVPFHSGDVLVNRFGEIKGNLRKECLGSNPMLIAYLAFNNVKILPVYWKHLSVVKINDGDESVENYDLILVTPMESLELPGFYLIPGFSNYLINKEGKLIKRSAWEDIIASPSVNGYYTYRMKDDYGHTGNRLRHRILAISLIPSNVPVSELTVNHINLVCGDDRISNLEWVTLEENIRHAREFNRDKMKRYPSVEIRDILSGEVMTYGNHTACAKYLNISPMTLVRWAQDGPCKPRRGYQIRWKDDNNSEWPEVSSTGYLFKLIFPSGKSIECNGMRAAKEVNLTRTSLARSLREGRNIINGIRIIHRGHLKPI